MNTFESNPIATSGESFAVDVLQASHRLPVLADFWAAWCGPCKALAASLNEIAGERAGSAVVAKVDVDAHPDLAARYHIRSIPSLLLFRDGEVVETFVGLRSKAEILQSIDAAISSVRTQASA